MENRSDHSGSENPKPDASPSNRSCGDLVMFTVTFFAVLFGAAGVIVNSLAAGLLGGLITVLGIGYFIGKLS